MTTTSVRVSDRIGTVMGPITLKLAYRARYVDYRSRHSQKNVGNIREIRPACDTRMSSPASNPRRDTLADSCYPRPKPTNRQTHTKGRVSARLSARLRHQRQGVCPPKAGCLPAVPAAHLPAAFARRITTEPEERNDVEWLEDGAAALQQMHHDKNRIEQLRPHIWPTSLPAQCRLSVTYVSTAVVVLTLALWVVLPESQVSNAGESASQHPPQQKLDTQSFDMLARSFEILPSDTLAEVNWPELERVAVWPMADTLRPFVETRLKY